LREGQPKLRQKIVEMGGAAAMEQQFGHPGIYPEQVGLTPSQISPTRDRSPFQYHSPQSPYHEQHRNAALAAAQTASMRQLGASMQAPPAQMDPSRLEMHAEMFHRLSIRDLTAHQDDARMTQQHNQQARATANRLRQMGQRLDEFGLPLGSQLSLLSNNSYGLDSAGGMQNESMLSMESSFRNRLNNMTTSQFSMGGTSVGTPIGMFGASTNSIGMMSSGMTSTGSEQLSPQHQSRDKLAGMDRRRVFARMKYNKPPSARSQSAFQSGRGYGFTGGEQQSQRSFDGMPDIHMVESSNSLYSNLSNMTDGQSNVPKPHPNQQQQPESILSVTHPDMRPPPQVEKVKVVDHSSREIHWHGHGGSMMGLGADSKHSAMSGMSRIDDFSIDSSIMGKIPNASTRSMAMSEISAIDLQERENEDESSSNTGFDHGMLEGTIGY
jgi:hypothetical protein